MNGIFWFKVCIESLLWYVCSFGNIFYWCFFKVDVGKYGYNGSYGIFVGYSYIL